MLFLRWLGARPLPPEQLEPGHASNAEFFAAPLAVRRGLLERRVPQTRDAESVSGEDTEVQRATAGVSLMGTCWWTVKSRLSARFRHYCWILWLG